MGSRMWFLAVFMLAVFALAVSGSAQQIRFEDFSDVSNLQFNGSPHQATWQSAKVLRMTDGALTLINPQVGTSYFNLQQPVAAGFTTWFEFQMHSPIACCTPGDGVAFIIQNSNMTDSTMGASGAGLTALGAGNGTTGGGMGYAGINNSLAIEFDIKSNDWDPNSNHVAVQSCGAVNYNTPVHEPGVYTIGNNHNVTSCLLFHDNNNIGTPSARIGPICGGINAICHDGAVNTVVIEYTPPSPPNQPTGTLSIWLNPDLIPGTHTPKPGAPTIVPPIAYTINDPTYGLTLDTSKCGQQQQNCGYAWVGFTASQPAKSTAQDILAWEFTPHMPIQITKQLQNGGMPTQFPFGGHQMDVTYPKGFMNQCDNNDPNCIYMTVVATPVPQTQFFVDRLWHTNFANEACVRYLQTGGNCIVYSVTCTQNNMPVSCPTEPPDNLITMQSKFTTTDPISTTNADFLETDPSGSNNWFSIFTSYDPNDYDGIVTGMGQGFRPIGSGPGGVSSADLVATFQRNKP